LEESNVQKKKTFLKFTRFLGAHGEAFPGQWLILLFFLGRGGGGGFGGGPLREKPPMPWVYPKGGSPT